MPADAGPEAVRVGVGRQDQVGSCLIGQVNRHRHRLWRLRVGRADRREAPAIRVALAFDRRHLDPAGPQRRQRARVPHPVQRREHHLQPRLAQRSRGHPLRQHVRVVGRVRLGRHARGVEHVDQLALLLLQRRQLRHRQDGPHQRRVAFAQHLRPVRPVDLDPVVLRRVMAGADHHPCPCPRRTDTRLARACSLAPQGQAQSPAEVEGGGIVASRVAMHPT